VENEGSRVNEHYQELLDALEYRYARASTDSLITVHWLDDQNRFRTEVMQNTPTQREAVATKFAGAQYDVWARMTTLRGDRRPGTGQRGLRADTHQACVLWVDVDPQLRLGETLTQWRERALEELEEFEPKPTRIESSGRGFYPLWAIEPTDDWEWVEGVNKWLAMRLGGDSGWDAAKILRLPGTLNAKPDVQEWAAAVRTGFSVCSKDAFRQASLSQDEREIRAVAIQPADLPPFYETEVDRWSSKLWMRIWREDTARAVNAHLRADGTGHVDRSANDYFIACELLRMNRTQSEVYAVLTHPEWFSGSKFRDNYNEAYVLGTISHAAATVEDSGRWRSIKESAEWILSRGEYRCFLGDWSVYDTNSGMFDSATGKQAIQLAVIGLAGSEWTPDKETGVLKYMAAKQTRHEWPQTKLVNVRNGMLDPLTGELLEHSAAFGCRYQIDAHWRPERVHTADVDAFVGSILMEDEVPLFWMFSGYCLYTAAPLPSRILLFVIGPPQTGKSELLLGLRYFLGKPFVTGLMLSDLTGENNFTSSGLLNSLLNIDDDVDANVHVKRTGLLKKLATGSLITVEKKGQTAVPMELPGKLAFAANGYPRMGMWLDDALQTRMRVLGVRTDHPPFDRDNPDRRVNAHLELLSVAENRNAWLYRSIEGYRALAALNWEFPESATSGERKSDMERSQDTVVAFLTQFDFENQEIPMMTLYHKYESWCAPIGERPTTWRKFSDRTKEVAERLGLAFHVGDRTIVWRVSDKPSI
jgi:hypothetical protein